MNALDNALRQAIVRKYPHLGDIELVNYKVRILDENKGTGAVTRVLLDASDGERTWGSIGVSENIIEASWQALVDSIEYGMLHGGQRRRERGARQPRSPTPAPAGDAATRPATPPTGCRSAACWSTARRATACSTATPCALLDRPAYEPGARRAGRGRGCRRCARSRPVLPSQDRRRGPELPGPRRRARHGGQGRAHPLHEAAAAR